MPREGEGPEENTAGTTDAGSVVADSDSAETAIRRGAVDIRTREGARIHHDDAFVRHEGDALVVSESPDFDSAETERYEKRALSWYEVRHPRS